MRQKCLPRVTCHTPSTCAMPQKIRRENFRGTTQICEIHESFSPSKVSHYMVFKPQRICEGYGSHVCMCVCVSICLSVCLSVGYHASGYIPGLYVQSEAAYL